MFAKKGSGLRLILSMLMQPAFESKEEEEIEFLPQLSREQAASYLSSMGDQTGISSQTPLITSATVRAASTVGARKNHVRPASPFIREVRAACE